RLSAPLGLHSAKGLADDDPTVTLIGQSVNAVVATVLWAYFASIAILMGGELNATLRARRLARAEAPDAGEHVGRVPVAAAAAPRRADQAVAQDERVRARQPDHGLVRVRDRPRRQARDRGRPRRRSPPPPASRRASPAPRRAARPDAARSTGTARRRARRSPR